MPSARACSSAWRMLDSSSCPPATLPKPTILRHRDWLSLAPIPRTFADRPLDSLGAGSSLIRSLSALFLQTSRLRARSTEVKSSIGSRCADLSSSYVPRGATLCCWLNEIIKAKSTNEGALRNQSGSFSHSALSWCNATLVRPHSIDNSVVPTEELDGGPFTLQ